MAPATSRDEEGILVVQPLPDGRQWVLGLFGTSEAATIFCIAWSHGLQNYPEPLPPVAMVRAFPVTPRALVADEARKAEQKRAAGVS